MFSDIEERALELFDQLEPEHVQVKARTREIAKRVSEAVGYEVIMPSQIRTLAYLLGLKEPGRRKSYPTGVSHAKYIRTIESQFSPEDKIDVKALGVTKRRGRLRENSTSFPRVKVEEVFAHLSQSDKLDYTPERFAYALNKL